ncbi:MAG: Fic family protein [Polyangiaceae bacterium]
MRPVVVRARAAAVRVVPKRGDIASWHREAFKDVVPLDYYAGSFRQHDEKRPCLGIDVGVAGVAGFSFVLVLDAMNHLCRFIETQLASLELRWTELEGEKRMQRLAQIVGVAVGRFIHVHPFINGNGRLSRLLWSVLLARLGLPAKLSVIRRPGPPYDEVMAFAMRGDYGPAVELVLRALSEGPMPPSQLPLPKSP